MLSCFKIWDFLDLRESEWEKKPNPENGKQMEESQARSWVEHLSLCSSDSRGIAFTVLKRCRCVQILRRRFLFFSAFSDGYWLRPPTHHADTVLFGAPVAQKWDQVLQGLIFSCFCIKPIWDIELLVIESSNLCKLVWLCAIFLFLGWLVVITNQPF